MNLTYFVELPGPRLAEVLQPEVFDLLQSSGATLALAMLDTSSERQAVIEELNRRRIAVTAWLLLDRAAGYWLTADNVEHVFARYHEVRSWLRQHRLQVEAFGLDLEPPHHDLSAIVEHGGPALLQLFHRRRTKATLQRATERYAALVNEIHGHGYRVEAYQFPLVLDERSAGSTLLQRTFGFVDVATDRDVIMLYESFLPSWWSSALIDLYGGEAQAIAVGISGGGVEFLLQRARHRFLSAAQLLNSLARAGRYTKQLYVFSLEGCIAAGSLATLCHASLPPAPPPARSTVIGTMCRAALRSVLRLDRSLS